MMVNLSKEATRHINWITNLYTQEVKEMANLEMQVNCGIGDLLYIHSQLESVKHMYNKIYITPNVSILSQSERGKKNYFYLSFLQDFMNLLFSREPYSVVPFCELDNKKKEVSCLINMSPSYPCLDAISLRRSYGIPFRQPCLASKLCLGSSLSIKEKYIVLTTRAREFSYEIYKNLKDSLFNTLNETAKNSNIKILLLGDRDMGKTLDVTVHGIFSIYSDAISALDPSIMIDLTVDKSLVSRPIGLKSLQQDCLFMNESLAVISLGIGGNASLSIASEARVINLSDPSRALHNIWSDLYYEKTNLLDFLNLKGGAEKRVLVTKDYSRFLDYIKNISLYNKT